MITIKQRWLRLALPLAALVLVACASTPPATGVDKDSSFAYQVITFHIDPEDRADLSADALTLRAIPGVVDLEVGSVVAFDDRLLGWWRDDYDMAIVIKFAGEAATEGYGAHPLHQAFIEKWDRKRLPGFTALRMKSGAELINPPAGKDVDFDLLLKLAKCNDADCAKSTVHSEYNRCFVEHADRSWGDYFRFVDCHESSDDGLVVGFGLGNQGDNSASIATANQSTVEQLHQALEAHGFVRNKTAEEITGNEKRTFYASKEIPGVEIMWGEVAANSGVNSWHVGIMWQTNP